MKRFIATILPALFAVAGFAQSIPFHFDLHLRPVTITGLQGVHSFAAAQSAGKWLVIGGRIDGIHSRQPFSSFPVTSNNTNVYVIDVYNKTFWSASVNALPASLREQLQSTNMNFIQDGDSLYLVGGYGYSAAAADHITYPHLTSVSVSGLISAVVNSTSIAPHFKQITDQKFAVTGGQMGKIADTFYLVGGNRFDGRYNPQGHNTYTQTYTDGIRKFRINNAGSQLSFSGYSVITDQVHLHRRDFNLVPQVFPDGKHGYTLFSGVFQQSADLPFLYSVDITQNAYTPVQSFVQYLNNYHSAKMALYDSVSNVMHTVFFGGISQYAYVNGVLTQDNNVPFVKTIGRVSRDGSGNLQEYAMPVEMPALVGAGAEFMPSIGVPRHGNDIISLPAVGADSVLAGHILGGIYSPQTNPFTANQSSVTSAHDVIYEVWLVKTTITGLTALNGTNPFRVRVFPNPAGNEVTIATALPPGSDLVLFVTDLNGHLVLEHHFRGVSFEGVRLDLSDERKFTPGLYHFNFLADGKFIAIEKVILSK